MSYRDLTKAASAASSYSSKSFLNQILSWNPSFPLNFNLFSPRGLHAWRAIAYRPIIRSACVNFFFLLKINLWAKLSRDLLNRFSQNFHPGRYLIVDYGFDLFSDGSKYVAMATNFGVIIGKIGLFTFIRSPEIPKRVAISPFWF